MNVTSPRLPTPLAPARPEPRLREFGVGYGASSGYVRRRGYASSSLSPRFRMG